VGGTKTRGRQWCKQLHRHHTHHQQPRPPFPKPLVKSPRNSNRSAAEFSVCFKGRVTLFAVDLI
jgi:hypothetical protein